MNAARINQAKDDPFKALRLAFEYLTSVLRQASHRDGPEAAGWCWALIHVIDAVAAAIERREQPHSWFRDRKNWRLNPDGWAPLGPVTATFRTLTRRLGQEDHR